MSSVNNEGAHPNPFNPSVTLRYGVKEPGEVSIKVYSITGQVVRSLFSEQVLAPGFRTAVWDGSSDSGKLVASGMYIARITTPSST